MSGSFESVRWNACMHRPRFILSSERVLGNEVRTNVNSMGKSPHWYVDQVLNLLPFALSRSRLAQSDWFVACLTSQQHSSVFQGRICSGNFTCCHTEVEVTDPTFHLIQSQYIDTWPTSPSTDPITPGAWQGSHWGANF